MIALGLKLVAAVCVVVGAAGVTYAVTTPGSAAAVPARAWIDRPLDGSALPGPLEVFAHATDPDGVVRLVLSVDGTDVDAEAVGGDELETAELSWPATEGTHTLVVVGLDAGEHRGTAARVTVVIDPDAPRIRSTTTTTNPSATTTSTSVATSTTVPGVTVAPTTTPGAATAPTAPPGTTAGTAPPVTPTTAPCRAVTPAPTAPADGSRTTSRRPTFTWSYGGACVPSRFQLQISRDAGFARILVDAAIGGTRRSYTVEQDLDCNAVHYWRLQAVTSISTSSPSPTWSVMVVCATRTG